MAAQRRRWLRRFADANGDRPVGEVVEAVAQRVAGIEPGIELAAVGDPPGGWADPQLVGAVHEVLVSAEDRGRRGAFYTPVDIVELLVERAIPVPGALPNFVIDPTCGGGAFLLAALDRLIEGGCSPADALDRIGGIDIDEGAVSAARGAVRTWGVLAGLEPDSADSAVERIVVGDQLEGWPPAWPEVDVVVGNPPFATPLRGREFPPAAQGARDQRRDRLGPYADLAAVHLVVALERCRPGARVVMVLPQSLLAGRDGQAMRAWVDRIAPMQSLWATREPVFDAGIRVWAPVLVVGAPERMKESTWAEEAAFALGAPRTHLSGRGDTLASMVSATAGFRDEFYALAAACFEADDHAPADERRMRLATVGSLDPLVTWWGKRPTQFAKRRWDRPVIDVADIADSKRAWVEHQRRPKVLLPTQSRILEPVVDRHGDLAPVTPLVALHMDAEHLDLVAAVLLAPTVSAWCHAQWFGTAMSVGAIKVAARDVGSIPLPFDETAWVEAARLIAAADGAEPIVAHEIAIAVAMIMNEAYRSDAAVSQWWLERARLLRP